MKMSDNANLTVELAEAAEEVIYAALRQLEFMGKGKEPSPRLQEAIDKAREVIARAKVPA